MHGTIPRRLGIMAAVLLAAIVFLLPTFMPHTFEGVTWISKKISLGLDLSGGVHLVYRVETQEAVKSKLQGRIQAIRDDLRQEKIAVLRPSVNERNELEITLLSERNAQRAKEKIEQSQRDLLYVTQAQDGERVKLVYTLSAQNIQQIERESVKQAVETLRNRVDQFGVSEPLIQQVGTERIMLQMPGVSDIEQVKRVVGKTAKLEFRLVPVGASEGAIKLKDRNGNPVNLEDQVQLSGDAVDSASDSFRDGVTPEVSLSLTNEGGKRFYQITKEHVGRQLAIILDGVVYSDPVIREPISGGNASISGGFTGQEASQLARILRAGALPAPLTVLEERTVGPTLGRDSIEKGILAILVGMGFILIFMLLYYRKSGAVAIASIFLNLFFLLALLSAFGATLTLPGLAGLALTAGMAVDSNVIIFERIRDELRIGATRDAAVNAGFDKALSAIMDSNLTTLLSGVVLYAFGTGPIRGFAVTLCIGVLTTIFCATFAARLAFDFFDLKSRKAALSI